MSKHKEQIENDYTIICNLLKLYDTELSKDKTNLKLMHTTYYNLLYFKASYFDNDELVFKYCTSKEQATKNEEPWFTIVDVEIDNDNPRNGAFELDWNEYFVQMLRSHGLTGDTDEHVVDQWFQDLCKQIALEQYEEDVFAESIVQGKEIEGGRREYE